MSELKKEVVADKSDNIEKVTTWWLLDTSLLTSGFNFDETTHLAGCKHRMIKISANDDGFGDDDNLSSLKKIDDAVFMPSKMKEVH
eukprot:1518389-Heterocapsa_arctica.AAC.1